LARMRFDLLDISHKLENRLDKKNVIAGWFAPQFGLNTKLKTLPSYNLSPNYLKTNGVTHLLLQDNIIREDFERMRLKYIEDYYISNIKTRLFLYEIID